jgi:hypothetical protein
MKILTGATLLAAVALALSACGNSAAKCSGCATITKLPAPIARQITAEARSTIQSFGDRSIKTVQVYGPYSRYLLVKASSGDLVQKLASERRGYYLIVLHGHFVAGSHPAGTKAPQGTIETQVWSLHSGVTDTSISDRLPAGVSRLHKLTAISWS